MIPVYGAIVPHALMMEFHDSVVVKTGFIVEMIVMSLAFVIAVVNNVTKPVIKRRDFMLMEAWKMQRKRADRSGFHFCGSCYYGMQTLGVCSATYHTAGRKSDFTKSGCRDHMKKYVSSGDSVCPLELEVKVAAKQHHNHGVRLKTRERTNAIRN